MSDINSRNASVTTADTTKNCHAVDTPPSSSNTVSTSVLLEDNRTLEEAVQLLQDEISQDYYDSFHHQYSTNSSEEFIPHAYNICKPASHESSIIVAEPRRQKDKLHLLNTLLIHDEEPVVGMGIPMRRRKSGAQVNIIGPPSFPQYKDNFTESQVENLIDTIHHYRLERKREYHDDNYIYNDLETNIGSPIQHIDSNSIHDGDLFSMWKLAALFVCCLLLPPLCFLVASSFFISDFQLMKMVLKTRLQMALWNGFVWDVDMSWLRRTCLLLGLLEILAVLACVGVGFGVGLTAGR